jgi:hypothetical protein
VSATLHARNISYAFGSTEVISGVTVSLHPGQRVGIVGPNGVGKSTLLRLMAGHIDPEAGSVVTSPLDAAVGYLPQEPDREPDETVMDFLARRTGVTDATARLEAASEALAKGAQGADDEYADADMPPDDGEVCPNTAPYCMSEECGPLPPCSALCESGTMCCGSSCCEAGQVCCEVNRGGPMGGPECYWGHCPAGCPYCH